jgi:hypothetical protein
MAVPPKYLKRCRYKLDDYPGVGWPWDAGMQQSRDSDDLDRANFACVLAALGGESEIVSMFREKRWDVGGIERILIGDNGTPESEKALAIADDIQEKLDGLDFRLSCYAADQTWLYLYNPRRRTEYIRCHRKQYEFDSLTHLLSCVRGDNFQGRHGRQGRPWQLVSQFPVVRARLTRSKEGEMVRTFMVEVHAFFNTINDPSTFW